MQKQDLQILVNFGVQLKFLFVFFNSEQKSFTVLVLQTFWKFLRLLNKCLTKPDGGDIQIRG